MVTFSKWLLTGLNETTWKETLIRKLRQTFYTVYHSLQTPRRKGKMFPLPHEGDKVWWFLCLSILLFLENCTSDHRADSRGKQALTPYRKSWETLSKKVILLKGHLFFFLFFSFSVFFFFVSISIWKKTRYFLFMEVDDFRWGLSSCGRWAFEMQ